MKSLGVAYILLVLAGFWGVHKFYLGRPGMGLLYLLTCGFVGVGIIVDLFTLPSQVRKANFLDIIVEPLHKERLNKKLSNLEKEKLALTTAKKLKGRVTAIDIATASSLSLDESKDILDGFVSKSYADMNVTKSGLIVYEFPNFMDDERKSTDTMF